MIVLDASVVVTGVAERGSSGALAREAMRGSHLHAPELLDVEVLHAVRRMLRGGVIDLPVAELALTHLHQLPARRHAHGRLLPRCWELRDAVSAYDAQYVALAELLGATLVTADVRLSRAPGLRCDVRVLSA